MATKTAKVENYTAAQVATMLATYNPTSSAVDRKAQVDKLAEMFGKTARSIVAKLTREKVYVAKAYETKAGEKPVKKDAKADAIALIAGLTEAETESLTKANKTALDKIMAVFQRAAETPGAVDAVTAAAVAVADAEDAQE